MSQGVTRRICGLPEQRYLDYLDIRELEQLVSGIVAGARGRLSGSRGKLSLISTVDGAGLVVWWAFALAADRPTLHADEQGRQIRVLDQTFSL